MQAVVKRTLHARVSSFMNAGTSIGIMVAVPTVIVMTGAWRTAYLFHCPGHRWPVRDLVSCRRYRG
ncbi:hypothetical protein [Salinicola tamaricis]|uniref:hypothetical protein n=1 Tax=Salinicola tamaricis TaxID=1771309 RepID=UPI001F5DB1AC|nr:hypothetical protein [Salinicola tamaricis]